MIYNITFYHRYNIQHTTCNSKVWKQKIFIVCDMIYNI